MKHNLLKVDEVGLAADENVPVGDIKESYSLLSVQFYEGFVYLDRMLRLAYDFFGMPR